MGWGFSSRERVMVDSWCSYIFVWGLRSGIYAAAPRNMLLPYSVIPSELILLTRGVGMAGNFSDILLCCLVSFIEIFSNTTFYSTSLSSIVSCLFVVLTSIVSRDTPATFCFVRIKWRRLDHYFAFLVLRRVFSFIYSWVFPCWAAFLDLVPSQVALIMPLFF